jgi:hypothetical protein
MRKRAIWVAAMSVFAAFAATAALANAAGAAQWKSNGTPLTGSETVVAETSASTITIPGLATTCKASLALTISNSGGVGVATVNSMSLSGCHTGFETCTVTSATAPGTPWSGATSVVKENPYLKITGFENRIEYGGESCAASGLPFKYRGSIGGLFNNASSTLTFNAASAEATGASLKSVGETKTDYAAEYSVKQTGANAGQALTLS